MIPRHWIPIALGLSALCSATVSAAPVIRYSWDDCDPLVVSRDFTGPAVYTQTLSIVGLDAPVHDLSLIVGFLFNEIPPAWRFADLCGGSYGCGFQPCQPSGRVSTLLGGTACDTIPGLQLNASFWFGITPPISGLRIDGVGGGSFTPDPAVRYTLIRIAFDHSGSVAGPGGPGTCGGADQPLLFMIGSLTLNGVDQHDLVTWDNCMLTWNTPSYPHDCPLIVPVKNLTWGRIKALYR